jgi:hypothetical protein
MQSASQDRRALSCASISAIRLRMRSNSSSSARFISSTLLRFKVSRALRGVEGFTDGSAQTAGLATLMCDDCEESVEGVLRVALGCQALLAQRVMCQKRGDRLRGRSSERRPARSQCEALRQPAPFFAKPRHAQSHRRSNDRAHALFHRIWNSAVAGGDERLGVFQPTG